MRVTYPWMGLSDFLGSLCLSGLGELCIGARIWIYANGSTHSLADPFCRMGRPIVEWVKKTNGSEQIGRPLMCDYKLTS